MKPEISRNLWKPPSASRNRLCHIPLYDLLRVGIPDPRLLPLYRPAPGNVPTTVFMYLCRHRSNNTTNSTKLNKDQSRWDLMQKRREPIPGC